MQVEIKFSGFATSFQVFKLLRCFPFLFTGLYKFPPIGLDIRLSGGSGGPIVGSGATSLELFEEVW